MGFVTFVLVALGILVLILGWRWQNQPSNEVMAALKGIAQLKRLTEWLRDDLYALEDRVVQHEQNSGGESWAEVELRLHEIRQEEERVLQSLAQAQAQARFDIQTGTGDKYAATAVRTVNKFASSFASGLEQVTMVPEKYRNIIELDQFGMTVPEIAGRLGFSQDAVSMVLRTYQREKIGYEN